MGWWVEENTPALLVGLRDRSRCNRNIRSDSVYLDLPEGFARIGVALPICKSTKVNGVRVITRLIDNRIQTERSTIED